MRRWPLALVCLAGCTATHVALPIPVSSTSVPTTTEATTTTTVRRSRPFPITSSQLNLDDTARARPLPTTVWRPSGPGRWPLIVFGHGFRVGPAPYVALCEAWAAAGYVVAAPVFPGDVGPTASEAGLSSEPADLSFVISSLVSVPYVDPARIAVAGHSDGGEAALAAGFQTGMADPRVRAVIALSVQPLTASVVNRPGGLPILFAQSDRDTVNPLRRGLAAYDDAVAPKFLLVLHGADHLSPFAGQSPWASVVDRVTIDFLDRYVAGSAASTSALEADGSVAGVSTLTLVT